MIVFLSWRETPFWVDWHSPETVFHLAGSFSWCSSCSHKICSCLRSSSLISHDQYWSSYVFGWFPQFLQQSLRLSSTQGRSGFISSSSRQFFCAQLGTCFYSSGFFLDLKIFCFSYARFSRTFWRITSFIDGISSPSYICPVLIMTVSSRILCGNYH